MRMLFVENTLCLPFIYLFFLKSEKALISQFLKCIILLVLHSNDKQRAADRLFCARTCLPSGITGADTLLVNVCLIKIKAVPEALLSALWWDLSFLENKIDPAGQMWD